MELSKHLVLFRYVLAQFGYDSFEKLHDELATKQTGYDATGHSYFAGVLQGTPKPLDNQTLLAYDEAISTYEERLRTRWGGEFQSFKYYQYIALLFAEYYFDRLSTNAMLLCDLLNAFKHSHDDFSRLADYQPTDLKKLAYWMATGSGKTPLMHCNYWQILRYFPDWENIILITPNEGLSRQHYDEFRRSGIDARLYSGSEESLKTRPGEVLIIEITKLVRDKAGEGISVDVDYFSESKNLVFIDEGHKGQRSEEKTWKGLREHLTRGNGSFTFEYSATFGQIISNTTTDLLNEYSKAILIDYSYRHFYGDGYGKDFAVFNINVDDEYDERQTRLLLVGSLLGFYEQLSLFNRYADDMRAHQIERPLWVFVGSKVQGEANQSDITRVIRFFENVLADPSTLQRDVDNILGGESGLINPDGDDIFAKRFDSLKTTRPVSADILTVVFNGVGQLDAFQLKQADGEIGLRTRTGEGYFGVINIGDAPKYVKKLEENVEVVITVQDDSFTKSLFQEISGQSSTVNILIGSKKFIEGWNSWRVSSMGLMNMGKSEGAQIIQLFGRGVRLKGKEYSLQRQGAAAPYHLRALQTIAIVGLNASYMSNFLNYIEKETPDYREYDIDIRFNMPDDWEKKVLTVKTNPARLFRDHPVMLEVREGVLKRITIDLRTKVSVAVSGFNNAVAEEAGSYSRNFLHEYSTFLNWSQLWHEANRYKQLRGYRNLLIGQDTLKAVVLSSHYKLLSSANQFGLQEAITGKMQAVAGYVVKEYINKFYADKEKDHLTKHLTFDYLTRDHVVFPEGGKMIVRVPKDKTVDIDTLLKDAEKLYRTDDKDAIPTLHIANHLYSPVASWRKGDKFQDIKTAPVKLNKGETDFLEHLRWYLTSMATAFVGKEVFVLRNLSRRGVGFFIESSSFYPDFILWVVEGNRQHIFFLDPKGIRNMGNFTDDKIVFCSTLINDINTAIRQKASDEKLAVDVVLNAYILSVTDYDSVKKQWGDSGATEKDFENNHVLFMEDSKAYLNVLFKQVFS